MHAHSGRAEQGFAVHTPARYCKQGYTERLAGGMHIAMVDSTHHKGNG